MTQFELNVLERYATLDEDEKGTEKGFRLLCLHELLCSNIILSEDVKQKGKNGIRAVLAAVGVFLSLPQPRLQQQDKSVLLANVCNVLVSM